jgi:murein DD-endopeptidase
MLCQAPSPPVFSRGNVLGVPERVRWVEIFGVTPLAERLPELMLTFRGDPATPPSRFGTSSLGVLRPRLSLPLWLGRDAIPRRVPIYNLFNELQPDPREGWRVTKTRVRDFRGRTLTYDSHNGTDFAVPPGTIVTAAAPGRVVRVSNELNRGGLKVFLDHGDGLVTTSNHLARALVRVGDDVARGAPIGLSGMSGVDGLLLFPWSTPHVHYNVWLDGAYVDPFPKDDGATPRASLWASGDALPTPPTADERGDTRFTPTRFDPGRVDAALEACVHPGTRAACAAIDDPTLRGFSLLFQQLYFPTRFRADVPLYDATHARTPRLSLPFCAEDYDGVVFADDPR